MVLIEYTFQVYDGYESPIDDEIYEINCMFEIHGYSEQIQLAFVTHKRGSGNTINDAIQNAYNKLVNKMNIKHHVTITTMYVNKIYELLADDKHNGTGLAFYPLTEHIRQEFREHMN